MRAEDARRSSAHAVTHGAASQQGLQHAIAQAGFSPSLFWRVIGVGRRTDILNRLRLQWRGEARARGPCLWSTVERTLDVGHRKGRRQSPWLDWSGNAPNRRHGDRFSETSGFYSGLVV